jgi:hypothetical protein
MRDLLNFIFANLIPILVVVSIALRIIGGMKSHARKKQPPQTLRDLVEEQKDEEEYSAVWDRLQPDEEEAGPDSVYGKDSGAFHGAGGVSPAIQDIRPLLMPAPSPLPRSGPVPSLLSPALPLAPPLFTPEAVLFKPETAGEPEIRTKRKSPGERSAAAFFSRLEKLPPLRRAVILAEILGPPRGLSNFPASGRG